MKVKASLLACCIAGLPASSAYSDIPSNDPAKIAETSKDDWNPAPVKIYPAHSGPVLILDGPAPAIVKYEFIGQVKIREGGYRSSESIQDRALAHRARGLGADAVIEVKRWRQPAGFSWAAPHADGKAVRILNKEELGDLSRLGPLY